MNGPESNAWKLLRPALRRAGILGMRVENMLDDGFPDVVAQNNIRGTLFVELKARPDVPRQATNLALGKKYGLRQSQLNWWLEARRCGAQGLIVSRLGSLFFAHDEIWSDDINAWSYEAFCDHACARSIDEIIMEMTNARKRP